MARREFNVFSLSFLDCICCGFGAVLLLFVMVNSRSGEVDVPEPTFVPDLSSEVNRLKEEVLHGRKNLVLARNTLEETKDEQVKTEGLARQVIERLEDSREELAAYDKSTLAKLAHINKLKADIQSMEKDRKRLEGGLQPVESEDPGDKIRQFVGDGTRQYLTGLKVGGRRILVLVDDSASMLGSKLVDILVRRNLSEEDRRRAGKWRQAVRTVEWITAQFPEDAQFQVYTFNEKAEPLLQETAGDWMRVADIEKLNGTIAALHKRVPQGGTSLHHAFQVIKLMQPPPDNVILLTDGLPTMRERKSSKARISGRERMSIFRDALRKIPKGIPVNVVLFPMEGDPEAASAFWVLAKATKGSLLSPSADWP